jgi:hypothetical protein
MSAPPPSQFHDLAIEFWREHADQNATDRSAAEGGEISTAYETLDAKMDSVENAWIVVRALIETVPSFQLLSYVGTTFVEDTYDYFGPQALRRMLECIESDFGPKVVEKVREGILL